MLSLSWKEEHSQDGFTECFKKEEKMEIKIAGMGCPKCKKTGKILKEVLQELSMEAEIEKTQDPREFPKLGFFLLLRL